MPFACSPSSQETAGRVLCELRPESDFQSSLDYISKTKLKKKQTYKATSIANIHGAIKSR